MYGSLPNAEQLKVFWRAAKDTRKVIVATNIAETSITIPNIVYGILVVLCMSVVSRLTVTQRRD